MNITGKDKSSIRWIHISDFHVGKDNYAQRKLFKEMIDYVCCLTEQGFSPDLIFITGDIANEGLINEYSIFKSEFLLPLMNKLPYEVGNRIFIIPGNHDVFRDTHQYFARDEICNQESHFFDPTIEGLNERKQLLPRFENYITSDIIPNGWIDSEHGFFSYKLNIKGIDIGIAGINTAWLSKNGDRHLLSPGINLLEDALEKLHDTQLKVVLGHHPIDWFHDDQIPPIRSLLGRHNALYLHGHLHKSRVSPEDGAGYGFLCVQSGAGFQSRSDEKWVNGLLLAELYPIECTLHLQPREWNRANRDWALSKDLPERRRLPGSDWWIFPLPIKENVLNNVSKSECIATCLRYPEGWQIIDSAFISRQKESLDRSHYLQYFDGAEPDWSIVSSDLIPKRSIVSTIINELQNYNRKDKPQVVLIYGPVGEGKSTVVMKAVVELLKLETPLNILWNQNNALYLKKEDIMNLPQTDIPWLLVSDSADIIAEDIKNVCEMLTRNNRYDIRFLICCRDTDWNASKAHTWHWTKFAYLSKIILSGLIIDDAREIVKLWIDFGEEASGELYGLDLHEATGKLMAAAHSEAKKGKGALIGAILKVRYGELLKEHIKTLLARLSMREIPGGSNLLDAFCYVAAMHAEGLMYLSRPVLSEALYCPLEYLNSYVLIPLGMEAATSNDGQFILTRHKMIAEISIELMKEVFQINFDQIYYNLINAAMTAKFTNYIPLLPQWTYSYPGHFSKKGRIDLAIRFGKRVLEKTPNNSSLITSLSVIYRRAGNRFEAVELFRDYKGDVFEPRGYYSEWGAAEGAYGNYYLSIYLLFYSLCDQVSKLPPRKSVALKVFHSLFEYFKEVQRKYLDPEFIHARENSNYLKNILLFNKGAKSSLEEDGDINCKDIHNEGGDTELTDITVKITNLLESFYFTLDYLGHADDIDILKGILPKDLVFNGLLRLLKSALGKADLSNENNVQGFVKNK